MNSGTASNMKLLYNPSKITFPAKPIPCPPTQRYAQELTNIAYAIGVAIAV